jgi:hypothetical protein
MVCWEQQRTDLEVRGTGFLDSPGKGSSARSDATLGGTRRWCSRHRLLQHTPADFVAIGLVLLVTSVAHWAALGNGFFGSDTWPWLVSTRTDRPDDVLRVAFSPIMSGTNFVTEVALFYHPLTALTYALDQALFGLNPSAFYATNLFLHLTATLALYSLARGVGLNWFASAGTALVLGLHPIASATVPSMPRRQDLVVGVFLLGSMSLLVRSGIAQARLSMGKLAAALVLYVMALGGKEIAYAAVAVVPLVIAASVVGPPGDTSRTTRSTIMRRATAIVAAFVALEGVAFAIRWLVLGGLGGYHGSETVTGQIDGILEYYVRPYITYALWPFQAWMPDRLRDWLLLVGALAIVIGMALVNISRRRQVLAVLALGWQATFLLLYVAVHNSINPYLLYVPIAGLALLVGVLLHGAFDALRDVGESSRRARLTRRAALVGGACAILVQVGVVRSAVVGFGSTEFRAASAVSERFVEQATACLASVPPGGLVTVTGLPHRILFGTAESNFVDAYVFEPYSLESVVRLLAPTTLPHVSVQSIQEVTVRQATVRLDCTRQGDVWLISTSIS